MKHTMRTRQPPSLDVNMRMYQSIHANKCTYILLRLLLLRVCVENVDNFKYILNANSFLFRSTKHRPIHFSQFIIIYLKCFCCCLFADSRIIIIISGKKNYVRLVIVVSEF